MWKNTLNVLRRHRKFIKGNKRHQKAYKEGLKNIHNWYRDEILDQIRDAVRSRREPKKTLYNIMVLARHRPLEVFKQVYRRIYCVIRDKGGFAS